MAKTEPTQELSTVQKAWRVIQGYAELEILNPENVATQISERVLSAQSDDDVFSAADLGLKSGEDMVGVPVGILGVQWAKSNFADGAGYWAVVEVLTKEGKDTFSIGANTALIQLFKWGQLMYWDQRQMEGNMVFAKIQEKTTGSGNRVYYFVPVSKPERDSIPV